MATKKQNNTTFLTEKDFDTPISYSLKEIKPKRVRCAGCKKLFDKEKLFKVVAEQHFPQVKILHNPGTSFEYENVTHFSSFYMYQETMKYAKINDFVVVARMPDVSIGTVTLNKVCSEECLNFFLLKEV